jgi:hypothetical protein
MSTFPDPQRIAWENYKIQILLVVLYTELQEKGFLLEKKRVCASIFCS